MKVKVILATIISSMIFLLAFYTATAHAVISSINLGTLGGYGGDALGINDLGEVVGLSITDRGWEHAFLWSKDRMIDLGTLSGYGRSNAHDINNLGFVVGRSSTSDANTHAVLWERDQQDENIRIIDLGTLGGLHSFANAINDKNQIVGTSNRINDSGSRGFLWENGTMSELGTLGGVESRAYDINNLGFIVGDCETLSGEQHACMWAHNKVVDLGTLGGDWSIAFSINDFNQIAGVSETEEGYWHAFIWQGGEMQDLGTLGGNTSWALGINCDGNIVGFSTNSLGKQYGFIWSEGVMTGIDGGANAINKQSKVVGNYSLDLNNYHAVIWIVKSYK